MFFLSDDPLFSDEELLLMCAASGGKTVEDTATGNPLTFTTDIAKPLKSLLIPFTPVQSGTGDPSPQNIRSIVPCNGLTVGQSRWLYIEQGEYNYAYGYKQDSATRIRSDYIPVKAGTYKISCTGMNNIVMYVFDTSKRFLVSESQRIWTNTTFTFTITDDRLVAFVWRKTGDVEITPSDISNVILNVNTTEHYDSITETDISFPSPVYGGTLDVVSGVLTVTYKRIEITSIRDILTAGTGIRIWRVNLANPNKSVATTASNKNLFFAEEYVSNNTASEGNIYVTGTDGGTIIICPYEAQQSIETKEDADAWLAENPVVYCYPLATPVEIQLTPAQITALLGNNTIWSDADREMTAVYLKKG